MAPKITKTVSDKSPAKRSNIWLERVVCVLFGATIVTVIPPIFNVLQTRFGKSEFEQGMERIEAWSKCLDQNRQDDFEKTKAICGASPEEYDQKKK